MKHVDYGMSSYHATLEFHTETKKFTYQRCGKYEAFDEDGTPILRFGSECAISDTKQLAASKCIEGAIFAVLKNIVNATGDATGSGEPISVSVYELPSNPDLDCSKTVYGDFALIEEVRFEDPDRFPINAHRIGTYQIPAATAADVELTYLPQVYTKSEVLEEWGEFVKEGINMFINTENYPTIEEKYSINRPKPEKYIA